MESKTSPAENREIMYVDHERRQIPIEIRGPSSPEDEELLLDAVANFLGEIVSKDSRLDSKPIMQKRTWQAPKPKPKVSEDLRAKVDALAVPVLKSLKKRFCKTPKGPKFNWPSDVFTRWHRDALYFVAIIRTPHGFPESFETRIARMEHAGDGLFNLSVPMRRGWMTIESGTTPEKCSV